jgi:heptosyltransferase-2
MNIGMVLPNWAGDLAMATPAIRAVRKHVGSQARLVGILRPYAAGVLSGLDWFDELTLYDPKSRDRSLGTLALVQRLRARGLDTILLFSNSLRTGAVAWLSGARRRVGYVRYGRGPLLTDRLYPPRVDGRLTPVSAVDYFLEIAYRIGCPPEPRRLELATDSAEEQAAEDAWQRLGLTRWNRVVALNTGGAYGAAKHWPTVRFADLARRLVDERPDVAVLVLCGPKEREAAAAVEQAADHERVVSLARESLSLGLTKACVRRSRLLVTTDSGPRHFAAAFGIPAVTLFGPTDPRWSWNYHPGELILQEQLPCVPCSKRVCPLRHHRCMQDLNVEKVYAAVQRQLDSTAGNKAA